ncbi:LacI family transcriptional regulator [Flavobacterium johnsoniae]|uniref:LacI family transcriptional regulator n=1 Tax=Flavobacterium potami TaxID=2872310 RepID=A0A9X1H853_9FLAO|nr:MULTISPECIES: LacI family DNA-binding transcriptional regulator [Flavobacterium]MBZ4033882.1 LacI family transcriptional regulator [Flavobacterium potami]WET04055.1 LacI family DNA-binding transcriptional regulator [Flavobacterium sp. YJ01]WJS94542.1 LacI family transcriptional regulator [Flavobacterium johnsoniae]
MKYITIKDIAKQLNTSVSTVSRAFNDKADINPETKALVLKTAKALGYRPNPIAKKLMQQRSFTIGIIVPEFINAFFPEVIIGVQEILFENGYQVLIAQSSECFETELKNIKTLEDSMVDGLIVSLSSESNNTDYYQNLIASGFPIVLFNRVNNQLNCSKVVFNDYKWAFFATEHLINQGCKNIVHLKGRDGVSLTNERLRGFLDAHQKYQLSYNKNQIVATGFTLADGQKAAQNIIDSGNIPDAIFGANDPVTIGAMQVFKKNGFSIPNDIAFVGFTDSQMATIIEPPLTSVSQPAREIGEEAAKILIEQIETKKGFQPKSITLNGQLNIRASSLKITSLK